MVEDRSEGREVSGLLELDVAVVVVVEVCRTKMVSPKVCRFRVTQTVPEHSAAVNIQTSIHIVTA